MGEIDTYKGESAGKKLARLNFWLRVRKELGNLAFHAGPHIYLASRCGGDASVLKGLGVPATAQIAVDRCGDAAAAFARQHPDVTTHVDDVRKIVWRHQRAFASVFLDLCSNLTEDALALFRDVASACRHGAVYGHAVMRGREGTAKMHEIHRQRFSLAGFYSEMEPYVVRTSEVHVSLGEDDRVNDGRAQLAKEHLASWLRPQRCALMGIGRIVYHSRSAETVGSPMVIDAFSVHREARGTSLAAFERRCATTTAARIVRGISARREVLGGPGSFDPAAERAVMTDPWSMVDILSRFDLADVDERAFALAADDVLPGRGHLIANVPRSTLTAWKAHATRGTYERRSA